MIGEGAILDDTVFCLKCGEKTEHQIVKQHLSDTKRVVKTIEQTFSYTEKEQTKTDYEKIETESYFTYDTYRQIIECTKCKEKRASIRTLTQKHNRQVSSFEVILIEPLRRDRAIKKEFIEYLEHKKSFLYTYVEAIFAYNSHLDFATSTILYMLLEQIYKDRNHNSFDSFKEELNQKGIFDYNFGVLEEIYSWNKKENKELVFDESRLRIHIDTFNYLIDSLYISELKKQIHFENIGNYQSRGR